MAYVLDTNVLSELMRERPDPGVLARLASLDDSAWYITAVTEAETSHGLALLPTGRKKTRLGTALPPFLGQDFGGGIIAFDGPADAYYADIMVVRSKAGRPMQMQDAMIAACCLARVATLVTRNTLDFEGLGLALFNRWP